MAAAVADGRGGVWAVDVMGMADMQSNIDAKINVKTTRFIMVNGLMGFVLMFRHSGLTALREA